MPSEEELLEAVINVSEGRDAVRIAEIGGAAGGLLLDTHSDPYHHRSVFTLAGEPSEVEAAAVALAETALRLLDLNGHTGVHPRLGVLDVLPFVPYLAPFERALAARDRVGNRLGGLGLPCFAYGPERSLPEVRRQAWRTLFPDFGPSAPHPTGGSCCVGARGVLVAYNIIVSADLENAKVVARGLRNPTVRALAFDVGERTQLSFNLIDPTSTGPEDVYDDVAREMTIEEAELVGLIPEAVLSAVAPARHGELGLSWDRTVEARLALGRA